MSSSADAHAVSVACNACAGSCRACSGLSFDAVETQSRGAVSPGTSRAGSSLSWLFRARSPRCHEPTTDSGKEDVSVLATCWSRTQHWAVKTLYPKTLSRERRCCRQSPCKGAQGTSHLSKEEAARPSQGPPGFGERSPLTQPQPCTRVCRQEAAEVPGMRTWPKERR